MTNETLRPVEQAIIQTMDPDHFRNFGSFIRAFHILPQFIITKGLSIILEDDTIGHNFLDSTTEELYRLYPDQPDFDEKIEVGNKIWQAYKEARHLVVPTLKQSSL